MQATQWFETDYLNELGRLPQAPSWEEIAKEESGNWLWMFDTWAAQYQQQSNFEYWMWVKDLAMSAGDATTFFNAFENAYTKDLWDPRSPEYYFIAVAADPLKERRDWQDLMGEEFAGAVKEFLEMNPDKDNDFTAAVMRQCDEMITEIVNEFFTACQNMSASLDTAQPPPAPAPVDSQTPWQVATADEQAQVRSAFALLYPTAAQDDATIQTWFNGYVAPEGGTWEQSDEKEAFVATYLAELARQAGTQQAAQTSSTMPDSKAVPSEVIDAARNFLKTLGNITDEKIEELLDEEHREKLIDLLTKLKTIKTLQNSETSTP